MEYYDSLEALPRLPGCIVTAGTFDGVHLGHQQILAMVRRQALAAGVPSVVITYHPHPRQVLFPEQTDLRLLTTLAEKRELIAEAGIDVMVALPFTLEFSKWSYIEYIDRVLVAGLGLGGGQGAFVVGYDHQFGQGREGSFDKLGAVASDRGFNLIEVPAHQVERNAVSSSKIRRALAAGRAEEAARLLGRPYSFGGEVVHGRKLGRELGYPTLNIDLPDATKLLPAKGIYAVEVRLEHLAGPRPGGLWAGMMSIGDNPTIAGKGFSCEVHLFDHRADSYGRQASVFVLHWLRPEARFDDLKALTSQIRADEHLARALLVVAHV